MLRTAVRGAYYCNSINLPSYQLQTIAQHMTGAVVYVAYSSTTDAPTADQHLQPRGVLVNAEWATVAVRMLSMGCHLSRGMFPRARCSLSPLVRRGIQEIKKQKSCTGQIFLPSHVQ